MKFLILHPFLTAGGGAEVVSARILAHLAERGHQVCLLTVDDPDAARAALRALSTSPAAGRVDIQQIAWGGAFARFAKPPALLGYALLLRAARRHPARVEADIVLSTYGESDIAGRRGQGSYIHYPVFADGTGATAHIGGRLAGKGWIRPVYRALCRALAGYGGWRSEALCLTNSGWTAGEIRRLIPAADPQVVYCPVEPFAVAAGQGGGRRSADLRLLCLGRLVGYKGHARIVDALGRAARATGHSFAVTFAGRGAAEDAARLRALAMPFVDVDVVLNPSRDAIGAVIARCDLGVSAFRHEHFGIAVAELTASGLPVLVPGGGGQTEIVPDARFVYRSDDELVQRVAHLASDPQALGVLRQAVAGARRRFAPEAFVARFDAALAQLFPEYAYERAA